MDDVRCLLTVALLLFLVPAVSHSEDTCPPPNEFTHERSIYADSPLTGPRPYRPLLVFIANDSPRVDSLANQAVEQIAVGDFDAQESSRPTCWLTSRRCAIDIPAGDASDTVRALIHQTGMMGLFKAYKGQTAAVRGCYPVVSAMSLMFTEALTYEVDDDVLVVSQGHPPAGMVYFEIQAGEVRDTFDTWAKEAHKQVLYDAVALRNIPTNPIRGWFDPLQAAQVMLAGSLYLPDLVNSHTLAIVLNPHPPQRIRKRSRWRTLLDRLRVRQPSKLGTLPQVVINGARDIPGVIDSPTGIQGLNFTRDDLARAGRPTLEEFLTTVPQVWGGGPTDHTMRGAEAASNFALGAGVNLRGLDAGSTLVLLNGHRLPRGGSEGAFVDITSIPESLIERIDIIPDTSSTLYGGDAAGGIFNAVLRSRIEGVESSISTGTAIGGLRTERADLVAGHAWGQEHPAQFLIGLEGYDRGALPASARPQATQYLVPLGGSDWRSRYCGNITDGQHTWAIPKAPTSAPLTSSQLVLGTTNLCDQYSGTDVLPGDRRLSGYLRASMALTPSVDLWGDALVSERRMSKRTFAYTAPISVPTTNPYYVAPVGISGPTTVLYNFDRDLGPATWDVNSRTYVFSTGATWRLADQWTANFYESFARLNAVEDLSNLVDFGALAQLLGSSEPTAAFNPYGTSVNTPSVIDSIRASLPFHLKSQTEETELSIAGPVLRLPGGALSLTLGTQFRKETMTATSQSAPAAASAIGTKPVSTAQPFGMHVVSYFIENKIPLFGEDNRKPGIDQLELSAGIRRECYSDFGAVTVPQAGLTWSPMKSVRLRGAWSQAYSPPPLPDLSETFNLSAVFDLPDPRSPTGTTHALAWTGGNADLRTSRARDWSFGIDFSPGAVPFTMSMSYFDIRFNGRIIPPRILSNDLLTNPVNAWMVTRNPTHEQIANVCSRSTFLGDPTMCTSSSVSAIVDLRDANAAMLLSRGIDFRARYAQPTGIGSFTAGLDGTYLLNYDLRTTPGSELQELRNTQNEPLALRMRGSLDWQLGVVGAELAVNVASGYRDIASQPTRNVSAWTTADVQFRYSIGGSSRDALQVTVNVSNIANTAAPFLNNTIGIGYDEENASLQGRVLSVQLQKHW